MKLSFLLIIDKLYLIQADELAVFRIPAKQFVTHGIRVRKVRAFPLDPEKFIVVVLEIEAALAGG